MNLATYRQTLLDAKTRCDLIMLNSVIRRNNINTEQISFLDVLLAMCVAGLLGGVLANLRGFFEFYREDSTFPVYLQIPYLLRPLTGMLCGMLVFFLTSVIVTTTTLSIDTNVVPFKAMITFMGIAILAGFSSQDFTEKLKAAASVMFGASLSQKDETQVQTEVEETEDSLENKSGDPNAPSILGRASIISESKPKIRFKGRNIIYRNRD